jgi:hypothetical protein
VDGRERHEDVELFTPHYRGAHAASRGKTGFRIYVVGSRGSGGRSGRIRASWRTSCDARISRDDRRWTRRRRCGSQDERIAGGCGAHARRVTFRESTIFERFQPPFGSSR